jgi:hypothetical protein
MIYIWDNHHRNETIRMCIDSINRVQGMHVEFNFCETDAEKITVWVKVKEKNYAIYLYWLDLSCAIKKQNASEINFEELTEKQYLSLCKYIMIGIWDTVGIIE